MLNDKQPDLSWTWFFMPSIQSLTNSGPPSETLSFSSDDRDTEDRKVLRDIWHQKGNRLIYKNQRLVCLGDAWHKTVTIWKREGLWNHRHDLRDSFLGNLSENPDENGVFITETTTTDSILGTTQTTKRVRICENSDLYEMFFEYDDRHHLYAESAD